MAGPFRSRTLLAARTLTHVDHVLARLDAQHVAVVHREHGVIAGLQPWVEDGGRRLFVDSGAGYSACGEFVCLGKRLALQPPPRPGSYAIWLGADGRAFARPEAAGRAGDAIRLGVAEVVLEGKQTSWGSLSVERREVRRPNPPHVAGGTASFGQHDVAFDAADRERRMSVVVDTRGGRFERMPLYFATVGAIERGGAATGAPLRGIAGWFVTIEEPGPTQFTLQARVHAEDPIWRFITVNHFPGVSVEVNWIGVLPRRSGEASATGP